MEEASNDDPSLPEGNNGDTTVSSLKLNSPTTAMCNVPLSALNQNTPMGVAPHLFFVGTNSNSSDNLIHLISYFDDCYESICSSSFKHPVGGIVAMALLDSQGTSNSEKTDFTIATAHASNTLNLSDSNDAVSIWRCNVHIPNVAYLEAMQQGNTMDYMNQDMTHLLTFEDFKNPLYHVHSLKWQNMERHLCIVDQKGCHIFQDSESNFTPTSFLGIHETTCEAAVWDPHNTNVIITVHSNCKDILPGVHTRGGNLCIWDLRMQNTTDTVPKAEKLNPHGTLYAPLTVDANANMQYKIVTGGTDAAIRFWDTRKISTPIKEVYDVHGHWVTSVCLNPFHDQLLLTASTDGNVKVHRYETVFATDSKKDSTAPDEIISSDDRAEDSIVRLDWSADDAWIFCALANDGYVAFHQIPSKEKYRILL